MSPNLDQSAPQLLARPLSSSDPSGLPSSTVALIAAGMISLGFLALCVRVRLRIAKRRPTREDNSWPDLVSPHRAFVSSRVRLEEIDRDATPAPPPTPAFHSERSVPPQPLSTPAAAAPGAKRSQRSCGGDLAASAALHDARKAIEAVFRQVAAEHAVRNFFAGEETAEEETAEEETVGEQTAGEETAGEQMANGEEVKGQMVMDETCSSPNSNLYFRRPLPQRRRGSSTAAQCRSHRTPSSEMPAPSSLPAPGSFPEAGTRSTPSSLLFSPPPQPERFSLMEYNDTYSHQVTPGIQRQEAPVILAEAPTAALAGRDRGPSVKV